MCLFYPGIPGYGAGLPYRLDFNAGVAGTVADKAGLGTGFEKVAAFSGTRLSADGTPTDPAKPWYEASKLAISGGALRLTTNKGIGYQTNNNQLNALAVAVNGSNGLVVEATLVQPFYGTDAQQAGVWLGLNDHTFLKLVVVGNRLELRREINDVSDGRGTADMRQSSIISGLDTKTVQIRLVVDASTGRAQGYYSTDGTTYANVGASYSQPWLDVSAMGLTGSSVLSGILATHRNATTPVTYAFDSFQVKANAETPAPSSSTGDVKINFQPSTSATPTDYTADTGKAFDATRGFGWVDPSTKQPKDQSASMRERSGTTDIRLRTLVQMQQTNTKGETPGSWEMAVANGTYSVTVSAGDPSYLDSKHQVNVEGVAAISGFVPTSTEKFRSGTVTVTVQDGKLTLDANGGTNTKLNYVLVSPVTDQTARINFQPSTSATPTDYTADTGKAFDATRGFGWVDPSTKQPKDQSASMRERSGTTDIRLRTLVQMQQTNTKGETPGSWEMAVANGTYSVTVSAGDPSYLDSKHQVNVEGVAAISGFVPTSTEKFRSGTVIVEVSDGKLTIDANGGTNTKLNYAIIAPSTETAKALAFSPTTLSFTAEQGNSVSSKSISLSASSGTPAVKLSKSAGADWLTLPAANLGTITFGASNINTNQTPGTYQATVTASADGYTSASVQVTLTVTQPASSQDIKINFQLASSATPSGYTADAGQAYDATRGFGWVDPSTKQPKDHTASMRQRSGTADIRLRTLAQMQVSTNGETPGSWELAVPNGAYSVTVSVGDPSYFNSRHQLNVEGVAAIKDFVPTEEQWSKSATVTVKVQDGKLTLDATGGLNTKLNYTIVKQVPESELLRPFVTAVRPADDATLVPLDQSISVDLEFPSGMSLNGSTVNPNTVKLYTVAVGGGAEVAGTAVNSTGGGDAITLSATLKPNTTYEFQITDQVKDGNGYPMIPFTSRFTTTSTTPETPTDLAGVSFTESTLIDNTFGTDGFTSLAIGPDHRLYAATSGGKIERWDINADGTFNNHVTIAPFGTDRRLLIGLRFDPAATASNLIAWISHSDPNFTGAAEWSGKISRVNLTTPASPQVVDYVINLPRSYKDHSTNSIDFGPDGALYVVQGSNSGMGSPDAAWGNRSEKLLNAAVLRLDIARAKVVGLPVDVKTADGGSYNPYASGAPLTIYASGVRNAYDLVWHSNGQLYVPTNGSAAGSNIPALKNGMTWSNGQVYTGPDIPALTDVRQTQGDYLFRVQKGGYYGHPNVLRNEYIMNGGNPTSREDPGEIVWTIDGVNYGYAVGTPAEPNYRGWAYDFGLNISPNGAIEYKSNAFGGKLQGKIMVCRFSGGDDIITLEPGTSNLDIIRATEGIKIPGLRRPFANPLDVIEDVATGNLYLSEYYDGNGDGRPRITLLKADQPASSSQTVSAALQSISTTADATKSAESYQLRVWPNPSSGDRVHVELKGFGPGESVKVMMYDITGQQVQSRNVQTDGTGAVTTELPVPSGTNQGVYMIRAASASGKAQGKLLVTH
ncbi:Ig-like domain-containing protein [Pontibacter liquoris]|uniref:Ig-like domain-containing protein n=1 Tax=Pontibacter liquoris TaxID=2905677 RepID=UPI001FA79970|nr:Ig-like domain-containing protein [Pontibacter liquoris]